MNNEVITTNQLNEFNKTFNNEEFKSFHQLSEHQKTIFIPLVLQIDTIIKTDMVWDNIVSLSGSAGVGKTFVASKIIELFTMSRYSVTLTAPTHKAVKVLSTMLAENNISNITSKTIQSFLNLKQQKDYNTGKVKFIPDRTKDIVTTDLLIVDESSMIGSDLYEYIIQAIEQEKCKAVLFIGDYYQLPSIESKVSPIFSLNNQYKLKEIVRQAKESYIIKISSKIRDIIKSKAYEDITHFIESNSDNKLEIFYNQEEFINDFTTPDEWVVEDKILTSFKNDDVDYYNGLIRKKYWEDKNIYTPKALIKGDMLVFQTALVLQDKIIYQNNDEVEVSKVEESFLPISSYQLLYWECTSRVGNHTFNVLNSQSKVLYKELLDKLALKAKKEKNTQIRKKTWHQFFTLKEFFVDVKYSFASTIHKLQGSTYETVYIDLSAIANSYTYAKDKDLLFRLLYVALTRASKTVKILLPDNKSNLYYQKQKNILSNMDFDF